GDAVAALLGEEIRPCFELVVVDRLGIAGVEVFDLELELDIHVNLNHPPRTLTAPRASLLPLPRRMRAWALPRSLRTLSRLWQSTQAVLLAAAAAGHRQVGSGSPNLSRGRAGRPKTREAKSAHYMVRHFA